MDKKNVIIAIDGYSSCGKSTVAKALAKKLNYIYVDSGAMYRAVTLYLIENEIDIKDIQRVKEALLAIHIEIHLENDKSIVLLNNRDVTENIREMRVSELVSDVSTIKEVRTAMVAQQQRMGRNKNIVMDGRDIGSTVFPNAQVKIFMTADSKVRADRRFIELKKSGKTVTLEEVFENLAHRDFQDTTRKESPLVRSEDAILLDNSYMDQEQQLNFVINEVKKVVEAKSNSCYGEKQD